MMPATVTEKDETWQRFLALKDKARKDLAAAEAELNELFRSGTVPIDLDGPTDGILALDAADLTLSLAQAEFSKVS